MIASQARKVAKPQLPLDSISAWGTFLDGSNADSAGAGADGKGGEDRSTVVDTVHGHSSIRDHDDRSTGHGHSSIRDRASGTEDRQEAARLPKTLKAGKALPRTEMIIQYDVVLPQQPVSGPTGDTIQACHMAAAARKGDHKLIVFTNGDSCSLPCIFVDS